eukprot:s1265_g16.t1
MNESTVPSPLPLRVTCEMLAKTGAISATQLPVLGSGNSGTSLSEMTCMAKEQGEKLDDDSGDVLRSATTEITFFRRRHLLKRCEPIDMDRPRCSQATERACSILFPPFGNAFVLVSLTVPLRVQLMKIGCPCPPTQDLSTQYGQ